MSPYATDEQREAWRERQELEHWQKYGRYGDDAPQFAPGEPCPAALRARPRQEPGK